MLQKNVNILLHSFATRARIKRGDSVEGEGVVCMYMAPGSSFKQETRRKPN